MHSFRTTMPRTPHDPAGPLRTVAAISFALGLSLSSGLLLGACGDLQPPVDAPAPQAPPDGPAAPAAVPLLPAPAPAPAPHVTAKPVPGIETVPFVSR